ncbi:MAG: winged helix-turn-helix transcriptional regulator [candidate division WS1 bacterium]|jgi:ArsR family transcriptional regulator|nr:winged helix-turn-helix transcriptional regulator [candidate division WS1 bacterium]
MSDTRDSVESLAELFRTLGHPLRLQILMQIIEGEFCVQEIGERLDRNQPNISQHLSVLRDRNVVTPERQGKRVCYRMADERIAAIVKNALEIMSSESGQ